MGLLWPTALRRPRATLAAVFLLVALAALQVPRLGLDPSIQFLSDDDPVAVADDRQRRLFGDPLQLITGLYAPREQGEGGVLREESLRALEDLHRALEAEPSVRRVSSLVNAPVFAEARAFGAEAAAGPAVGEPLLQDPSTPPDELRRRLRAAPIQSALLLSARESLAPVWIELAPDADPSEAADRVAELARRIERDHPGAGRVPVTGPALVETALARHVLRDLSRLVPFTALLIALGLGLYLRRPVYLGVIVAHIVALEALVLGSMAAAGWSIDLVSVLAPVIVLPVGVADLLHLCVRLRSGSVNRADGDPLEAAFRGLQSPMAVTTVTTTLGFLGFVLSPVEAISRFGAVLSASAVAALALTLTLDAAWLRLFWRPAERAERTRAGFLARWIFRLGSDRASRRLQSRAAVAIFVAAGAVGLLALPRLRIDDTWLQNFDPASRVRQDTAIFESELMGTNVLSVIFEADPAVAGSRERLVRVAHRFTTDYLSVPDSRGVLSATLLARAFDPSQGQIWQPWTPPPPDDFAGIFDRWRERGLVLPRMESYADREATRFRVQVFVLQLPYDALVEQVARVEGHARGIAGPGVRATVTGDLATNVHMVRRAVSGQALSLSALVVTVFLLLAWTGRSWASGARLSLPMILAILASYGLLVLAEMPYGIAVSMFPTLVVGLSVDFAIHLRAAWRAGGSGPAARATERLRHARHVAVTLRGIVLNGVLWTLGFGLLAVSALPPNRYLGILCAAVIAGSTTLTLLLVPILARLRYRDQGRRGLRKSSVHAHETPTDNATSPPSRALAGT